MDWNIVIKIINSASSPLSTLLGSAVVAALVSGVWNHYTKIKAIKESGLYKIRADVLDNFIKLFTQLQNNFKAYTIVDSSLKDGQERERIRGEIGQEFSKFAIFCVQNQHFFKKEHFEKILKLKDIFYEQIVRYNYVVYPDINSDKFNGEELIKVNKELNKIEKDFNEIVDDFRKLIGVE